MLQRFNKRRILKEKRKHGVSSQALLLAFQRFKQVESSMSHFGKFSEKNICYFQLPSISDFRIHLSLLFFPDGLSSPPRRLLVSHASPICRGGATRDAKEINGTRPFQSLFQRENPRTVFTNWMPIMRIIDTDTLFWQCRWLAPCQKLGYMLYGPNIAKYSQLSDTDNTTHLTWSLYHFLSVFMCVSFLVEGNATNAAASSV